MSQSYQDWVAQLSASISPSSEADSFKTNQQVASLIEEIQDVIKRMKTILVKTWKEMEKKKIEGSLALVQNLYNQFKSAYESRNDSLVMSFISDSWEAGDGTTLADLQMNFSRSFRTFDEIRYDIQNLKIDMMQDGIYSVGYDVTITSRIYKRNIRHEEKSSVREDVITDDSGKLKVSRTGAGRFWHTQ